MILIRIRLGWPVKRCWEKTPLLRPEECFSSRFVEVTEALLDSETPVIATVASRGSGLIARVKTRDDVELVEVTRRNRGELPRELAARLNAHRM